MKRKVVVSAICVIALGASFLLSGCTHGIGDTAKLVSSAEKAKQSIEQMVNTGSDRQSVGTVADPNYQPVNRLAVTEFTVSFQDDLFAAAWSIDTNYDSLRIQIFADTDREGEDGTKIASLSDAPAFGEQVFESNVLDSGTYYCYIKVISSDNSFVVAYCDTPVEFTQKKAEGLLENIQVKVEDDKIILTWDGADYEKFRAMLFGDDASTLLSETTIVSSEAKLTIPEDYDFVYVGVASLEDGVVGEYELYKVDLNAESEEVSE